MRLSLALCLLLAALPAWGQPGRDKLATGPGHGAWLKPDGTLWTWGSDRYGQLGRSGGESGRPARIPGIGPARDVACGGRFTLALLADGTVLAFGGQGAETAGAQAVAGLEGIVALAASEGAALALASDGAVWEWEEGSGGPPPRRVPGLAGAVAVAAGETHRAALLADGAVLLWGAHGAGDLGNGCYGCAEEPVRTPALPGVVELAAGREFTVARTADGAVWTLGYGEAGQLGDGTRRSADRWVQVKGLAGATAIAAGTLHALALKGDGTLWAWGDNRFGELGNAGYDFSAPDIRPDNHPLPVRCGGLAGVKAVAAGGRHSLALDGRGRLLGFGDNDQGVLSPDVERLSQADAPMEVGQAMPDECRILFSCETAAGKFIRLCGEQDPRDPDVWRAVHYRFGPANGPPELMVPQHPANGPPVLFFSHTHLGGDYRVVVRFANNGYTYRVFSGSRSGAGVAVEDAKGRRIATVNCIERPELFAPHLWRALPCDRANPHGEAACGERPFRGK